MYMFDHVCGSLAHCCSVEVGMLSISHFVRVYLHLNQHQNKQAENKTVCSQSTSLSFCSLASWQQCNYYWNCPRPKISWVRRSRFFDIKRPQDLRLAWPGKSDAHWVKIWRRSTQEFRKAAKRYNMTHMTLKRKDAEKNRYKFYTQVHRGLRTSRRLSIKSGEKRNTS